MNRSKVLKHNSKLKRKKAERDSNIVPMSANEKKKMKKY